MIATMPVAKIAKAATTFKRLLTSNFVCENLVPIPMKPQMREKPIIYKGVIFPNNGRNASPAIRPANKALIPNAIERIISCFGLSIKKRFFPLLIFSVSRIILKVIMKQRMKTMTLAKPSNRFINVPPSNEPSQYISPCPADNANTNSMLRHQPFFFSRLKAEEATATQNVNDITKTMFME